MLIMVGWSVAADDQVAPGSQALSGRERALSLPGNQATVELVLSLEELLSQRQPETELQAVDLLQTLVQMPEEWIPRQGLYIGSREYVRQKFQSLTPAGRGAYVRLLEPQARQQLDAALRSRDADQIREVAVRFPETPAGEMAEGLWRQLLHDRGWVNWARAGLKPATVEDVETRPATTLEFAVPDGPIEPLDSVVHREAVQLQLSMAVENGRCPTPSLDLLVNDSRMLLKTPLGTWQWEQREPGQAILCKSSLTPLSHVPDQSLLERLFRDQFRNRLAQAGDLWFQLVDSDLQARSDEGQYAFRLVARRGEEEVWSHQPDPLTHCMLSPPVHGFDRIWLLEESATGSVELLSLVPETGGILARVALGQSLVPWTEDLPRQGRAGAVYPLAEGVICLTGAGAIVAVDPAFGTLTWGVRVERDDALEIDRRQQKQVPESTRWSSSREPHLLVRENDLMVVLPESNEIRGLRLDTGEPAFSLPSRRADRPLRLQGDELLVESVHELRSVRIPDGRLNWSMSFPEATGRGLLLGSAFYVPATRGQVIRVSLTDTSGFEPDQIGTLSKTDSGWDHPQVVAGDWPSQLFSLGNQIVRASIFGLNVVAQDQIVDLTQTPPQTLPASLVSDPVVGIFLDRLESRNWAESARLWAELLRNDDWCQQVVVLPEDQRACRQDRWLQGVIHTLYESLDPPSRNEMETHFGAALSAGPSDEPGPLLKIWDRAGEFPWVWRQRVAQVFRPSSSRDAALLQVQLLRQAELGTTPWSRAAQFRLAEFHADRGEVSQSRALLSGLTSGVTGSSETPPVMEFPFPQEIKLLTERLDRLPPARREWPHDLVPELHRTERFSGDIFQEVLPRLGPNSSRDGWGELTLNWPGGTALQWKSSSWTLSEVLSLPKAQNALRSRRGLARSWELENVVIVQAGAELFGYWLQSSGGMPEIRPLWPLAPNAVTTLPRTGAQPVGIEATPPDRDSRSFRDPHHLEPVLNLFGLPIGAAGPVTSECVLIRQQAVLSAIHPATGDFLWRRFGTTHLQEVLADSRRIVLLFRDPIHGEYLEELRPADGKLLRRISSASVGNSRILTTSGTSRILLTPQDEGSFLISCQPVGGQPPVWSRNYPAGCVPFSIDTMQFGVVDPTRGIEIVSLESGELIHNVAVEIPPDHPDVLCTPMRNVLLIGLSQDAGDRKLENLDSRLMRRRRFLDGPLLAIDRSSGTVLWQQKFSGTLWSLDQVPDLPVFVVNEPRLDRDGFWRNSRLRVFNLYSGELLLNEESPGPQGINLVTTGHRARQVIRIRTQRELIELRYRTPHDPRSSP